MTNGEKLKEVFPDIQIFNVTENEQREKFIHIRLGGVCQAIELDWWSAECKEPTIKNNLGVDCISREQAVKTIQKYGVGCFDADEFSPEECERFVIAKLNKLPSVTPQPTKNDLGVDCISRKAVLDLPKRTMKNYFGEVVGEVVYVKDIMDLPSVTPQTRWIPVSERLPDTNDEVLCWYEYYHWSQEKVLPEYGIGCYFKETSAWYGEVAVGRDIRVIAWTPLQPYKAESEYRK